MIDNDIVTMCCGAKYKCQGRAKWICEDCKEDRSLEYVLMIDSQEKATRLERWRQAAINSKEAMEAKRVLKVIE